MGRAVFAKGCEFLLVSLGEGFGRSGVVGRFPVENEGKGEGGGEGGGVGSGQAKEPASQCERISQNYSLAIYPLVLSHKWPQGPQTTKYQNFHPGTNPFANFYKSVEPKVRLQGYGYSLFCSHSSRCLEALL